MCCGSPATGSGATTPRCTPATRAPIDLPRASFQSVGLSYVLHCLPVDMAAKAVVFDHLIPLIAPGGVLFGSTILVGGVRHTRVGRTLLRVAGAVGLFAAIVT